MEGLSEDGPHCLVGDRGSVFLGNRQVASRGFEIGVPEHLLDVGNRHALFDHVTSEGMFEAVTSFLPYPGENSNLAKQSVDLLPTETGPETANKKEL